ncbi:MAG: His-Xaa-Ser repeat protein HxsA3, partial [Eubacteriales bacterium]|nr:His-Xaa-Ser repeat protein HxsA3 [Eubacteriales bacterium]
MDFEELFPHVKHSVEDFLFDEEGNIPRSKILTIGSMMIVLSMLLTEKAFAGHRTHYTHRTHST